MLAYDHDGKKYRTIQFVFAGKGDQKVVLMCFCTEAQEATYGPIFDRAAASFRFDD